MDFVVVSQVRSRFGSRANQGQFDAEGNAPFVGRTESWSFNCPGVDAGESAIVTFQALGVQYIRSTLAINATAIAGGVPQGGFFLAPHLNPNGGVEGVYVGPCARWEIP